MRSYTLAVISKGKKNRTSLHDNPAYSSSNQERGTLDGSSLQGIMSDSPIWLLTSIVYHAASDKMEYATTTTFLKKAEKKIPPGAVQVANVNREDFEHTYEMIRSIKL